MVDHLLLTHVLLLIPCSYSAFSWLLRHGHAESRTRGLKNFLGSIKAMQVNLHFSYMGLARPTYLSSEM
ncbi:hypothetical protein TorRG33x02_253520 [Trema orientale]|uniref:Secreted protein n=1 Tax=Trema orientale TaxID=63057 RepID=A0A2P5DES7_TREOI|nr:hypothetical protein TorRG33x02_253520 [Trema orientale]